MTVRQLRPYEAMFSGIGLSLFLDLTGAVTPGAIQSAYAAASREHPSLRLAISAREEGKLEFVEQGNLEVPLVSEAVGDLSAFDWEERLLRVATAPRDHQASPVFMEHVGENSGGEWGARHFLFAVVNHAATDGAGIFSVFHSFCRQLGCIVSGADLYDVQPRAFVDILGRAPEAPEGYERPEIPSDLLPPLPYEGSDDCKYDTSIRSIHMEMSIEATERLVQNCRSRNCTVQGAVSASGMIAAAKAMRESHPLPQVLGIFAPINMRNQVTPPADAADCMCGSSCLWWTQRLEASQELFHVAEVATRSLHEKKSEGFQFAYWHWIQAEGWVPPVSVSPTSIGINTIQTQYRDLRVERVHLNVGQYGAKGPFDPTFVVVHLHTFGGRLCMTLGYSWPGVSDRTGREMAETQWACLGAMAEKRPEVRTVASMMN